MRRSLQMVQHVDTKPESFHILEIYESIDGPRTRVCSRKYKTLDAALIELLKRLNVVGESS